jgi:hypothetical protein
VVLTDPVHDDLLMLAAELRAVKGEPVSMSTVIEEMLAEARGGGSRLLTRWREANHE